MRRFRLLDVVPVARHFLVESMADGLLVLDAWDRVVDVNPTARYIDIRLSPLLDRDGSRSGSVLVIHDLSVRRALELEREKLITELQAALGDIKTLRGLLPICASCKEIRDDKGSWGGLERYIMDHSDAQFSHDICPECIRKLYPDLAP